MIHTPATHLFDQTENVCLLAMAHDMREWIMSVAPEANFSMVRKEGASVACYGDQYLPQLLLDYGTNAEAQIRTILCLTQPCGDSYLDLLRLHVRHVIYPGTPFDAEALRLAIFPPAPVDVSDDKEFFSLKPEEIDLAESYVVRTAVDIDEIISRTVAFFREHGHPDDESAGAALVIKEAVTNSLFHGFRATGSHERKYDPAAFTAMEDGDRIHVCLARAGETIVIRVTDNVGTLGPLRVGNSLDRQKTEKGIFDSRGRGFYLMRELSQRMVIVVERGVGTAVEAYFTKEPSHHGSSHAERHFEVYEI